MSPAKGLLVVFEGIDGAGKSTQADILAERLKKSGLDVVQSKEPTSGPWGQMLRNSATTGRLSLEEELSLFIKDRMDHVSNVIAPGLESGKIVILDRYYFSTAAYQGARGADPERILGMNSFAPLPDIVFFLDVCPQTGLCRIQKRGDSGNYFETEENLTRSASIFRSLRLPYFLRIDGEQNIQSVSRAIFDAFSAGPLFNSHCRKSSELQRCDTLSCGFWFDGSCEWKKICRL